MEMQPYTKHQQDDPDLGHLLRKMPVADKPGRVRTDDNTCEKISHNRRQPEPVGNIPKCKRGRKSPGKGQYEVNVVHALII